MTRHHITASFQRSGTFAAFAAALIAAFLAGFGHLDAQQVVVPPPPTADQAAQRQRDADERLRNDWAGLQRFRDANVALGAPRAGERRVVFMGNSITEGWSRHYPAMFTGKPYVNRGISGQTTPQMLVRFRQDVVSLRPAVVVILGGTNDIAGNTGPSSLEMIEDNLMSMTEIAQANGIRVVLASVLPVFDYPWRRGLAPAPKIDSLNAWMKSYAVKSGAVYLDYHSAMTDDRRGLRADLGSDGVHPNAAGYAIMAPLTEKAIAEALRLRPARDPLSQPHKRLDAAR